MGKIVQRFIIRRTKGKARNNARTRAVLFFVALAAATAGLSLWIEDRYHHAETAYRLYVADHPLKPAEKPPKIDWLTGKVWR